MCTCSTPLPGAPLVRLTLVGTGEPLLRMEKRLSCAAVGVGITLELDIRKDAEGQGIPPASTPVVMLDGQVILRCLLRTEEIEHFLRQRFTQKNISETEISND